MKKIITMLISALMLVLVGGLNIPAASAEPTVGQSVLLETARNGGENSAVLSSLSLPEKFSGEWSGVEGYVVVQADAVLELPDLSSVPVVTVERKPFSQEDADKMLEVFMKGGTLWQEQGMTKQKAQQLLEHYQAIERGEIPYEHDGSIDRVPGLIEYYGALAKSSPDENERFKASTTFEKVDDWNDGSISGYAEVDGKLIHARIYNNFSGLDQACFYVDGYGDVNNPFSYGEADNADPGFSEAAAMEMGDKLMAEIGNGSFVCDQIRAVAYYNESEGADVGVFDSGYEMEYVRTVNGFPIAYCSTYQISPDGEKWMMPALSGTSIPENEPFVGTWGYEHITVYVNKGGVVYFSWQNPYTEPEIETSDAQLMSFSDISDIFAKMIMVKNSDVSVINEKNGFNIIHNIDIDKVSLNMMRIRDRANYEEGLLVPVWDFWGTVSYDLEDEAYRNLVYDGKYYSIHLTVNAIDGTVIDRELGY